MIQTLLCCLFLGHTHGHTELIFRFWLKDGSNLIDLYLGKLQITAVTASTPEEFRDAAGKSILLLSFLSRYSETSALLY